MFGSECGTAADHRQKHCSACGTLLLEPRIPALPNTNRHRKIYFAAGIAAALLWAIGICGGVGRGSR